MNKPVRILHIISNLGKGGAELALSRLICSLSTDDYQHQVSSLTGRGAVADLIESQGVEVLGIWGLFRKKNTSPDLLCGWMYHGNLAALLISFLPGRPSTVIWNIRQCIHNRSMDRPLTRVLIWLGARLSRLKRVQRIIYNSEASRTQHQQIGYCAGKSDLMRNGFDDKRFSPENPPPEDFARIPGFYTIGIVARYHPVKGHALFIEAASRFQQLWQGNKRVRFLMVGRGLDSSNPDLLQLIEKHQLRNAILLGERNDIENILPQIDIVTSTSISEGFSNTIAESMLCGVPCVVTDVGDSAYIVGNSGLIVQSGDASAIADAWSTLLSLDPAKFQKKRELARYRISSQFSLAQQSKIFKAIISAYYGPDTKLPVKT